MNTENKDPIEMKVNNPEQGLEYVDEDVRKFLEGKEYILHTPLLIQMVKELRAIREELQLSNKKR